MDRTEFFESVHDALTHLDDLPYLSRHPLGRHLSRPGTELSADLLRRRLLQAIAQVRPRTGMSVTSSACRQYRYLELRCLNGESHEAVAREMGLSLRQAHRVRFAALDAVAAILWGLCTGESSRRADQPAHSQRQQGDESSATPPTILDDELARLAKEPAHSPTDLVAGTLDALEVIRPLVDGRGVIVDVEAAPSSVPVAVGRVVLRQMVILLLSCCLERQSEGNVVISIQAAGEEAVLGVVLSERAAADGESSAAEDSRLAMARLLADTQGGSLQELPVQGGRGRYLRLRLPLDQAATVLVVDDNPDLVSLFELYLQDTRYRLIEANTGQSAMRLAVQARPDVITLDVMMPLEDGWEIFRQLRQDPVTRDIPIVVCSILPEKDLAVSLGAAGFLAKPVTAPTLITALDQCLDSPRTASRDSASDSPSLRRRSSLRPGRRRPSSPPPVRRGPRRQ